MKSFKYFIPIVAVALIACVFATVFTRIFSDTASEKEVINLFESFNEASSNGDKEQLKNILEDPIEIITNGYKETLEREKYISLLMQTMEGVSSIKTSFFTISASEDKATIKCYLEINWKEKSSSGHQGYYTFLFKKSEGTWKIVSIQLQE